MPHGRERRDVLGDYKSVFPTVLRGLSPPATARPTLSKALPSSRNPSSASWQFASGPPSCAANAVLRVP